MNAMALLVWVSAFSSFGWGMFRFFRKPSGLTWRTALVGILGLVFGAGHFHAIAVSTAGPLPLCAGVVLLTSATALFWCAVRACGALRLTAISESDTPLQLVRRGTYRYIRHPFYASYTLFWFAGAIASGSMPALLSAAVMLGIYLNGALEEERKFAASTLATEYAQYRRGTGLMIPSFRKRAAGRESNRKSGDQEVGGSWSPVIGHRATGR